MSATNRLQVLGNLKLLVTLAIIAVVAWFLPTLPGAMFAVTVFIGALYWASQYTFKMYDIKKRLDGFSLLISFIFKNDLPHVVIGEGRIIKQTNTTMTSLGGAGLLAVKNDSAVVLESAQGGEVRGSGAHLFANQFASLRAVVDLRPQVRTEPVDAMTKDGVTIELTLSAGFNIDPGKHIPNKHNPFPFDDNAVLKAVYWNTHVLPTGGQPWHERVMEILKSHLRDLIATMTSEDLFDPQPSIINPRNALKTTLLNASTYDITTVGAQLKWVDIGTPKIPDAFRQQFETWRTKRWAAEAGIQLSDVAVDQMERLVTVLQAAGLNQMTVREILSQYFSRSPGV